MPEHNFFFQPQFFPTGLWGCACRLRVHFSCMFCDNDTVVNCDNDIVDNDIVDNDTVDNNDHANCASDPIFCASAIVID